MGWRVNEGDWNTPRLIFRGSWQKRALQYRPECPWSIEPRLLAARHSANRANRTEPVWQPHKGPSQSKYPPSLRNWRAWRVRRGGGWGLDRDRIAISWSTHCPPAPPCTSTEQQRRAQTRPCLHMIHRPAVPGGSARGTATFDGNQIEIFRRGLQSQRQCCFRQKQLFTGTTQPHHPTTTGSRTCHLVLLTTTTAVRETVVTGPSCLDKVVLA